MRTTSLDEVALVRAEFARLLQLHRYVGRVRVLLLGMLGRLPFGGQAWIYMNWLRGIQKLGHEVWYVEDEMTWPYDPLIDSARPRTARTR